MILIGDVIEQLKTLPDESVHCVVTSPPYWGLRDYGTATWEGGDAGCDHLGAPMPTRAGFNERYFGRESSDGNKQDALREPFKSVCGKCGAKRIDSQIGLEATPDLFVAKLVEVFREVKRVLRADGCCWVNLGDSYSGGKTGRDDKNTGGGLYNGRQAGWTGEETRNRPVPAGLKPKDLCGIPWRVAFALQADGWWLRQDIIWAKPNPMPESVTDRCTKAHEYLFLLTKSARYFFDADAIREPHKWQDKDELRVNAQARQQKRNLEDGKIRTQDGRHGKHVNRTEKGRNTLGWGEQTMTMSPAGANRRSVWNIPTQAYPDAHFATFPEKLVEPCIKAGCPKDGTVLDPFFGSGTTGLVAKKLGRKWLGIELNPEYAAMAEKRLAKVTHWQPELRLENL